MSYSTFKFDRFTSIVTQRPCKVNNHYLQHKNRDLVVKGEKSRNRITAPQKCLIYSKLSVIPVKRHRTLASSCSACTLCATRINFKLPKKTHTQTSTWSRNEKSATTNYLTIYMDIWNNWQDQAARRGACEETYMDAHIYLLRNPVFPYSFYLCIINVCVIHVIYQCYPVCNLADNQNKRY